MPNVNSIPMFKYGVQSKFDTIQKDVNTVYFITDTQRLFVGDVEYSRPVQHGNALPSTYVPANSFFYHETEKVLYFSEDGAEWVACSNFYEHPTFTAKVCGDNTKGKVAFGDSIKIPKVTVDSNGHVSSIEDVSITLPTETEETTLSLGTASGSGNAVTGIEVNGHTITLKKETSFATSAELQDLALTHTNNFNELSQMISDGLAGVTSFTVDSNDGAGYDSVSDLPETGTNGVFYLVNSGDDTNKYEEYFWTGSAYEKAGSFGSADLTEYAKKSDLTGKVDKTSKIVISGDATGTVTLGSDSNSLELTVNKAASATNADSAAKLDEGSVTVELTGKVTGSASVDATGKKISISTSVSKVDSAESADKLSSEKTFALSGAATGSVQSDLSNGLTINVESVAGDKVSGVVANATNAVNAEKATSADSATKATQDGNGNNISDTYATKQEVQNASITWQEF